MAWRRGQAYSQDLRSRVLASADEGERVGVIAARLRVSVSYVSKVLARRERTGITTALPQRCHVPGKLSGLDDALRTRVMARPDETLAELRAWLIETHDVTASPALLCTTLAELQLTYKKSPARGRAGPTGHRRGAWHLARATAKVAPASTDFH
jgi:transposase